VDIDLDRFASDLPFRESRDNVESYITAITADPLLAQLDTGDLSFEAFYKALVRQYGLAGSLTEFKSSWCDIFAPMPNIEPLLVKLQDKVKLGLLSNTDPLHWQYLLHEYPFLQGFSKPTLSFEIGFLKPEAKIYLHAAENVKTAPQQCLFIDDLEVNVAGARRIGMQALHFKSAAQLQHDLEAMEIL